MISVTKVVNNASSLPHRANGVIGYMDRTSKITDSLLEIRYVLENHSDSSALNVWSECFLENMSGYLARIIHNKGSRILVLLEYQGGAKNQPRLRDAEKLTEKDTVHKFKTAAA
jgi:hypothetical protein